jgi:hypothetical protein
LKKRGGSTQERIRNDKHHLIICPKGKRLQNWERFLHQRHAFFELGTFESSEVDPGHAIAVFPCTDDVICIGTFGIESFVNAERQRWPDRI